MFAWKDLPPALMSAKCPVSHNKRWQNVKEVHKQIQTFLLGESTAVWGVGVGQEAGWWLEMERQVWSTQHSCTMGHERLLSPPVAGPFTGYPSPGLKGTPHASPLPCQSTFLSHHSPTAVSGWRGVIIWTHLRPPACEEPGFVRVVVVARSHLVSNTLHVSYLMVWLLTSAG